MQEGVRGRIPRCCDDFYKHAFLSIFWYKFLLKTTFLNDGKNVIMRPGARTPLASLLLRRTKKVFNNYWK